MSNPFLFITTPAKTTHILFYLWRQKLAEKKVNEGWDDYNMKTNLANKREKRNKEELVHSTHRKHFHLHALCSRWSHHTSSCQEYTCCHLCIWSSDPDSGMCLKENTFQNPLTSINVYLPKWHANQSVLTQKATTEQKQKQFTFETAFLHIPLKRLSSKNVALFLYVWIWFQSDYPIRPRKNKSRGTPTTEL